VRVLIAVRKSTFKTPLAVAAGTLLPAHDDTRLNTLSVRSQPAATVDSLAGKGSTRSRSLRSRENWRTAKRWLRRPRQWRCRALVHVRMA
jgi:hypothetical protein